MVPFITIIRLLRYLQIVAHRSSTEEIFQLRKAFERFDVSHDGVITYDEFKQGLVNLNYSEDTIKEIFQSVVRAVSSIFQPMNPIVLTDYVVEKGYK